jgi:serine/threonine protein kinase
MIASGNIRELFWRSLQQIFQKRYYRQSPQSHYHQSYQHHLLDLDMVYRAYANALGINGEDSDTYAIENDTLRRLPIIGSDSIGDETVYTIPQATTHLLNLALELLERMLNVDENTRISLNEVLKSDFVQFFTSMSSSDDELEDSI